MLSTVIRLVLQGLLRLRVEGPVPLPAAGPLLYVIAHRGRLDSVLAGLFLPYRPLAILPAEEARSWWMRLLLLLVPHAIMDVNDPGTVKKLIRLLESGRAVAVFPEGRVVHAPTVMKNYDVPALVAGRAHALVVPVVTRMRPGWLPRVTLRLSAGLQAGGGAPASLHGARARRAWATQQFQRCLESAVLDARERHSLFDALLSALAAHGRCFQIIEDAQEKPKTYHYVLKGALAIGRWIARRTERGENVGVLLPNVIPTVCTIFGLMAFGRVPAMLNYTAGPVAARSACTAARVRTVIASRAFIEQAKLAPLVAALEGLDIVYLEDIRREFGWADKLWLLAFALWFPRLATRRARPDDPGVVVFTSGSEARPKGVVLSHENIITNYRQMATVMDFTPADRILNALPLYHTYSFTAGLMLCLLSGTRLFLYVSPLRYRAIPEIAYRRDVTGLYGTSTFLSYYARHANPLDFHTVRYVISGGEKLGEEVARLYLEKFGLRVYEGYGATESAPVIALSTPQCYRAGTVGRVLPGIEYRVEQVQGIEHGGVLHLKGPNVMLGYYRFSSPGVIQPPRSVYGDGWHCTGDVVDLGEDGVVRVVGRLGRFAKVAGEMVSLDEVERIAQHVSPGKLHAAVVRAESASGETTVLFTTDRELTRSALLHAARELGRRELAVARRVVWMPEIPLLGSGKTDYVTLQAVDMEERAANDPAALVLKAAEPIAPYR
jgi:acyl-[acyl-carrier-protein]-phospholipid O-acyltransferase / long-chain-fatty-acid--[acyl-carrier-protein] ligase